MAPGVTEDVCAKARRVTGKHERVWKMIYLASDRLFHAVWFSERAAATLTLLRKLPVRFSDKSSLRSKTGEEAATRREAFNADAGPQNTPNLAR